MFIFLFRLINLTVVPEKCMESGTIALTFDDGPTGYTPIILDMLNEEDVKATFHFTTQSITRPNINRILNQTIDEGHTVGLRINPSRSYDDMEYDDIKEEIEGQINVMNNVSGEDIKYVRAPIEDGIVNHNVYEVIKSNDMVQSGYTHCVYHDVTGEDEVEDYLNLLFSASNVKYDSFIFLLHEEKEKSFPTLENIISIGKEKGYKFVTLDDCLKNYKIGSVVKPISGGGKSGSNMKNSCAPILNNRIGLPFIDL